MPAEKPKKAASPQPSSLSPGVIRRAAILAGGFHPTTSEQQWQAVEDWYRYLEDYRGRNRPWVNGFNEAWDNLDYTLDDKPIVGRGKAAETAESLLATLFYYVDLGFYPPPEILAALLDCWETYRAADGKLTLEDAFIGKTKKGAGNYAKRDQARFLKLNMKWNFVDLLKQGRKRAEAAEIVSNMYGGKPDAESILRMFRGVSSPPQRISKAEK